MKHVGYPELDTHGFLSARERRREREGERGGEREGEREKIEKEIYYKSVSDERNV